MIWFFLTTLALILALVNIVLAKKTRTAVLVIELVLLYQLVIAVGLMGLMAAYGHTVNADQTATMIGWPTGSPFQFEVAMCNLGLGVLGLLCIFFRGNFWLATVIYTSVFFWGCAVGHFRDALIKGNFSPWNFGSGIIFNDLIYPVILLVLAIVYLNLKKRPS